MTYARSILFSGVAGCMLALGACASGGQGASGDPFSGAPPGFDGPVQFTIENNDFRDATIYGYWNGVRERLGMVTGKTSKTFSTDWKSEQFAFYVNFVGGGEYVSETVDVYAGDHLNFVIMPGL